VCKKHSLGSDPRISGPKDDQTRHLLNLGEKLTPCCAQHLLAQLRRGGLLNPLPATGKHQMGAPRPRHPGKTRHRLVVDPVWSTRPSHTRTQDSRSTLPNLFRPLIKFHSIINPISSHHNPTSHPSRGNPKQFGGIKVRLGQYGCIARKQSMLLSYSG